MTLEPIGRLLPNASLFPFYQQKRLKSIRIRLFERRVFARRFVLAVFSKDSGGFCGMVVRHWFSPPPRPAETPSQKLKKSEPLKIHLTATVGRND